MSETIDGIQRRIQQLEDELEQALSYDQPTAPIEAELEELYELYKQKENM